MKKFRIAHILLAVLMMVSLWGCGGNKGSAEETAPTWQEQYDLGIRYLSEGNYEEAIIAFTAAIEIDAKQPLAFIGRAEAHIASGETAETLAAALADYETAVGLDETNADAWLGMADVYIRQGDSDKAREILEQALEKVGENQAIADKLTELKPASLLDSLPQLELTSFECAYLPDWESSSEDAVGGVYHNAELQGADGVKYLEWCMAAYSREPAPEEIEAVIIRNLENLDKGNMESRVTPYPWAGGIYPVWPDELGKTWYIPYLALDENCQPVGYVLASAYVE